MTVNAADDDSSYIAAVEQMSKLPKISPPTPMVMPTLRPTPPVSKVERKRPLPFDTQWTMLEFEESTHRQSIQIGEQKDFTALTVGSLQHFVVISDKDVAVNETAGREIVGRGEERERMCMNEDFLASRHVVLVRTLERLQRDGEVAYQLAMELMAAVEKDEAAALDHALHWERTHRPPGIWAPNPLFKSSNPAVFRNTVNGVLVPAPPSSQSPGSPINPYKLTGQIRWQEEQQRTLANKRREQDRHDMAHDETCGRMDLQGDESRGFMSIETDHIAGIFKIKNVKSDANSSAAGIGEARSNGSTSKFGVEFSPIFNSEMRYNAATKIQSLGRQYLAKRTVQQKATERDAQVELLMKQDAARQSLLNDPMPLMGSKKEEEPSVSPSQTAPTTADTTAEKNAFVEKRTSVGSEEAGPLTPSNTVAMDSERQPQQQTTDQKENRGPVTGATADSVAVGAATSAPAEDTDDNSIDAIIARYFAAIGQQRVKKTVEEQDDETPIGGRISLRYLDCLVSSASDAEGKLTLKMSNKTAADTEAEKDESATATEPITTPWKALLQLAVTQGTHVDAISKVLTAYGEMPPAEEMLEEVQRKKCIDALPFCDRLLQQVIFGTHTHTYHSSVYASPTRWKSYGSEGDKEYVTEEDTDLLTREEEGRQKLIAAQIEAILGLFARMKAVAEMVAGHSPAPYSYAQAEGGVAIAP